MHPIVYYILLFLALGGIGMALGSRKASPEIRRQRWLKYFMYIFITGVIILGIFFHFFCWLAWLIVTASSVELIRAAIRGKIRLLTAVLSFVLWSMIATGFLFFAGSFNPSFLLFIYFPVLVFDGFCQVSGQLFGKRLIAPLISPAKTWEGFLGGWLFCIITTLLSTSWLPMPLWKGICFGLLTGILSLAGDLSASFYKRKTGIKDYSNWLPGQGGFLDRFDSFLATGAAYYLLSLLIFKETFTLFLK